MNEIKNLESANFDHLELLAGGQQAICPGGKKNYIWSGGKINICTGGSSKIYLVTAKLTFALVDKLRIAILPQNMKSNSSKYEKQNCSLIR